MKFAETLGQYLKRERESRDLSLEELSKATRIGRPFLEALEGDDFQFTQRDFVEGFLRLYARHLGLDPEEMLRRFRIQSDLDGGRKDFRQLSLFPLAYPPLESEEDPPPPPRQGRRNSFPFPRKAVIQVAVLCLAAGLSLYLHRSLKRETAGKPVPVEKAFSARDQGQGNGSMGKDGRANEIGPQETARRDRGSSAPKEKESVAGPKVIGHRKSKVYYSPGRDSLPIDPREGVEFDSEESAQKAGYRKARKGAEKK
ncbi:MAG: helix-turn-helix domain-containing protein [Deltaproteobacteria bacterium]|nr:helix-turn-helix domain-containing protein [Deltaproteobacteria bacterium]